MIRKTGLHTPSLLFIGHETVTLTALNFSFFSCKMKMLRAPIAYSVTQRNEIMLSMCDPRDNIQMLAITLLVLFTTYLLRESKCVRALTASEKPYWKTHLCRTCSSLVLSRGPGGRPLLRLAGENAVDNEGQVRAISAWMAHFYHAGTRAAILIHNFQEAKLSPRACLPAVIFKLTFPGSPSECIIPESPGFCLACCDCDTRE